MDSVTMAMTTPLEDFKKQLRVDHHGENVSVQLLE